MSLTASNQLNENNEKVNITNLEIKNVLISIEEQANAINEAGHALANRRLLLQANQDIELEYQIRRPDGSSCWLLEKGRRLPDGQIHAVLVDIGAHRQQMQVQQRNADSYRQALGAMYQLVFEVELERDSFMPITDVRSHIDTLLSG